MRILHYFLGFPPYRSGGLTKFATDMMTAQAERGDEVYALWPGRMSLMPVFLHTPGKKVKIKKRGIAGGVISCEIINPLPVSLDEGIGDCKAYMEECDKNIYLKFLKDIKPEVIHIHTLMGLHKEFMEAANELGIKVVFTSHDYFGLCPKVTLYRDGDVCEGEPGCEHCVQCNRNPLSLKKIALLQSPLYRGLKNSPLVKLLRKRHRNNFYSDTDLENAGSDKMHPEAGIHEATSEYRSLRTYYIEMYKRMNVIHFNSTLTQSIYQRFFEPQESRVISITHKDIGDNRHINKWEYSEKLRMTMLASARTFKGFQVLQRALDEMWAEGNRSFVLKLYKAVNNPSEYMEIDSDGFSYEDLGMVMANTDVLVAPSVWYETFGFTVLEALSYGVPVIVSDNVGAGDIVGDGGIVVKAGDVTELKSAIQSLTEDVQKRLRDKIQKECHIKVWDEFLDEMYALYKD